MHVLGLSLAFILSQDQTLRCKIDFCLRSRGARRRPRGTRGGTLLSRLPLLVLLPIPSKIALLEPPGPELPSLPGIPRSRGKRAAKVSVSSGTAKLFSRNPELFFPGPPRPPPGVPPFRKAGAKVRTFTGHASGRGGFFSEKFHREGQGRAQRAGGQRSREGGVPGARRNHFSALTEICFRTNGSLPAQ